VAGVLFGRSRGLGTENARAHGSGDMAVCVVEAVAKNTAGIAPAYTEYTVVTSARGGTWGTGRNRRMRTARLIREGEWAGIRNVESRMLM
jgi:hypothetical protein